MIVGDQGFEYLLVRGQIFVLLFELLVEIVSVVAENLDGRFDECRPFFFGLCDLHCVRCLLKGMIKISMACLPHLFDELHRVGMGVMPSTLP